MAVRTYVINLERRLDRLQSFSESIPESIKPICIYNAFDGRQLGPLTKNSKEVQLLKKVFCKKSSFRRGELGCWLSHLGMWFVAAENTQHTTVIFEDDNSF